MGIVIHKDNANELGEVLAAMAAMRAVVQGYGGGRGIHAAMTGVQCTVCLQESTGPQGNRVPKLLLCGHTFCSRCIANLTERNRASCPSCRAVTENADTAIHNNFALFNNQ